METQDVRQEEDTMNLDTYLAEHWDRTEDEGVAFRHYLDNNHHTNETNTVDEWEDYIRGFDDCYLGCMPWKEYVEQAFFDITLVPSHLIRYIDIDAVARDWEPDYWTVEDGNGCEYIFRNY